MGLPPRDLGVGPEILHGIEINPLAAELARTTIWIGDIQWSIRNGIYLVPSRFCARWMRSSAATRCSRRTTKAALLRLTGRTPISLSATHRFWAPKLMKRKLGQEATDAIRTTYAGRLPGFTDLVCYWFEKSRALIEGGEVVRAGLVATNSIRKNTNLPVMHRIAATTRIFEAWSEEKWTVDGAMVDVSLVCFGENGGGTVHLNGEAVDGINPDLTSGLDLTQAKPLPENKDGAFLGIQKSGPFDVTGTLARTWMSEPAESERAQQRRGAETLLERRRCHWSAPRHVVHRSATRAHKGRSGIVC